MNTQNNNKQLILFYAFAFLFSWMLWVPQALSDSNILKIPQFILSLSNYGAWGPLVAALGLTYFFEGKLGIKNLFKRVFNFKIGLRWYGIIFLTFPLILGGALLLSGESFSNIFTETNPIILIVGFFVILFTAGPLQEELGWRGYALDRLQEKWNALIASLIVGFMWGLWHLPLFYMHRTDSYYEGPILGLMLSTIIISILFTWIYNNTGRSLMAMLLFHTMWNYSHWIFPTLGSDKASLYMIISLAALAIFVILYYKPRAFLIQS